MVEIKVELTKEKCHYARDETFWIGEVKVAQTSSTRATERVNNTTRNNRYTVWPDDELAQR